MRVSQIWFLSVSVWESVQAEVGGRCMVFVVSVNVGRSSDSRLLQTKNEDVLNRMVVVVMLIVLSVQ